MVRDGSGYVDFTAYQAMKNIEKGQNNMKCKHGDIFEYKLSTGEMKLAVIVSPDWRSDDRYVNVICMTDELKGDISVPVSTVHGLMYADCKMVSFADTRRLDSFVQSVKEAEMQKIDEGIAECLGIEPQVIEKEVVKEVIKEVPKEVVKEVATTDRVELAKAKAEADVYKSLYEQLLAKVMG